MLLSIIASQPILDTVTPRKWEYVGTSADNDGSYDLGSSGTSDCRTSSAILSYLNSQTEGAYLHAQKYDMGFVMRIEHAYEMPSFAPGPCTPYYYKVVET
jgi:hypothetical protein